MTTWKNGDRFELMLKGEIVNIGQHDNAWLRPDGFAFNIRMADEDFEKHAKFVEPPYVPRVGDIIGQGRNAWAVTAIRESGSVVLNHITAVTPDVLTCFMLIYRPEAAS